MNRISTQWILSVAALSLVLWVTLSHTPPEPEIHLNWQPDVSRVDLPPPVDMSDPLLQVDIEQMLCMATNIYHEARGEGHQGMVAVAHVTLNRAQHPRFPNTVCDVVYQGEHRINWLGHRVPVLNRCHFSWYCDGRSDRALDQAAWISSMEVAQQVLLGEPDPTGGALFYYNPHKAQPGWRTHMVHTASIGSHTFLTLM